MFAIEGYRGALEYQRCKEWAKFGCIVKSSKFKTAFCCADLNYFALIGPSLDALPIHTFRNSAYIDYCRSILRAL